MPEEIHTALQSLLPRLPNGGRMHAATLYTPPQSLPMPPLNDLRAKYRSWLNPARLGYDAAERPLPPLPSPAATAAAASPAGAADVALVLAPIDPHGYVKKKAAASAVSAARAPSLTVERHPAAASVVARKMMKRMAEDVAWLTAQSQQAAVTIHKLNGFDNEAAGGGAGGAAAMAFPSVTDLQARERTVSRLTQALEALYKDDDERATRTFDAVQALVIEGGAAAPDTTRRARALAQMAGCELTPSLELLTSLLASGSAEKELHVLNPLLSSAEVSSRAERCEATTTTARLLVSL